MRKLSDCANLLRSLNLFLFSSIFVDSHRWQGCSTDAIKLDPAFLFRLVGCILARPSTLKCIRCDNVGAFWVGWG